MEPGPRYGLLGGAAFVDRRGGGHVAGITAVLRLVERDDDERIDLQGDRRAPVRRGSRSCRAICGPAVAVDARCLGAVDIIEVERQLHSEAVMAMSLFSSAARSSSTPGKLPDLPATEEAAAQVGAEGGGVEHVAGAAWVVSKQRPPESARACRAARCPAVGAVGDRGSGHRPTARSSRRGSRCD